MMKKTKPVPKKITYRKKELNLDIMRFGIDVYVGKDVPGIYREVYNSKWEGEAGGMHQEVSIHKSLIILPPDADVNTIAHEANHCVRIMLKQRGALEEKEFFAYYQGWLTQACYDFVHQSKPKAKKK